MKRMTAVDLVGSFQDLTIPPHVKTVIDEEFERLNVLEKHSAEFKYVSSEYSR